MFICEYLSEKWENAQQSLFGYDLHPICLGLTFTGLQSFKPFVLHISAAGSAAVPVPITARSTTTHPTRFLKRAALWARHRVGLSDGWRADWASGYELSFRVRPT